MSTMLRCAQNVFLPGVFVLLLSCNPVEHQNLATSPAQFSGIYPHLAYYNNESECGTGAVVPWAGSLWVVTYGPHLPFGSSDKLYEITDDLDIIARPESIGGTPANRMIHEETNQLFMGPYAIDSNRNVRVIPYDRAPGRHTGLARHLTDPQDKLFLATMEEGFYEVDVHTLETTTLFEDANVRNKGTSDIAVNQPGSLLPGAHGKGAYSGQGVLVYANNGEAVPEALTKFDIQSGALAEWNGKEWKVVRRNQFVEVTGPGGIHGNKAPATDPIWATGWDHKSVIVGVRGVGRWSFFRLPKASHSYDGAHGWNTEWPRIRDVGEPGHPDYLMTMHGMFWRFPSNFSVANAAGIRPRSAYLKVIGDFARWNDRLVFGCDDSAQKEFLNKRKVKGGIEGPGQSNSNLWFTSPHLPDELGPTTAGGAIWLNEYVKAAQPAEPFLFAGWPHRCAWISNHGNAAVVFSFETSRNGNGPWTFVRDISINAGESAMITFSEETPGEWIRLVADRDTKATAQFSYTDGDARPTSPSDIFDGLATISSGQSLGGLLYGLGNERRALGLHAMQFGRNAESGTGYYELTPEMKLEKKNDPETDRFIREKFAIRERPVTVDDASVLIVDDGGRRWRLPLGSESFTGLTDLGLLRVAREVATERDLFNCHGTFYELPAENADGFAKIRPVASHSFRIHDYASYRGMLVMTGIDLPGGNNNPHVIVSDDGKAAVWAGVIDDLWKMGRPTGRGGPWKDTRVVPGEPSDPYLIGFYDVRKLALSHNLSHPLTFMIEVDPIGHGPWMEYQEVTVAPGQNFQHTFADDFQARWIRFTASEAASVTAWLEYE